MSSPLLGEILPGLWRFEAPHPEWTEDEGGGDGWEEMVAWWALATGAGIVLIDPLVEDWPGLDALVEGGGGCAGVIRTCHWHQRTIEEVRARYRTDVWALPARDGGAGPALDRLVADGDELFGGAARVITVERDDEIGLWLPAQAALLFGDAMLRRADGELRRCPDSWTQPEGGPERLRALLGQLTSLPVEHVLVSHGPQRLGAGLDELRAATA
jgi:hypothetical protein